MRSQSIGLSTLRRAHAKFEANEPRNLFYRASTELVARALDGSSSLTVAEALAVLLQTWNRSYYRFRGFDKRHLRKIETLVMDHRHELARFRRSTLEELDLRRGQRIASLFKAFELALGPVGAAKALHLLAPRLFPLWDREIAAAYGLRLREAGINGESYWCFMLVARGQCLDLKGTAKLKWNPLKVIDEYNYCRFTKGWISR